MLKNRRVLKVSVVSVILGITSCGHKSTNDVGPGSNQGDAIPDFRSEPVGGKVGGGPWSFVGGIASLGSSGELEISLIDEKKSLPCDFSSRFSSDGKYVAFAVDHAIGSTTFPSSTNQYVSFGYQSSPDTAVKIGLGAGKVEIISLDDNRVKGRLFAKYDEQNMANGTFDIPYCGTVSPLVPVPPLPSSSTAPQAADPELTGRWYFDANVIIPARFKFDVAADQSSRFQVLLGGVAPIEDHNEIMVSSTNATPKRLKRTVTAVTKTDTNNPTTIGAVQYCIYDIGANAQGRTLKLECGGSDFPSSFGDHALDYFELKTTKESSQSQKYPKGEWSWLAGEVGEHVTAISQCEAFTGEPDSPGHWALPSKDFVKKSSFPIFKSITFWTSECNGDSCWAAHIEDGKWVEFISIPTMQKLPIICMKISSLKH